MFSRLSALPEWNPAQLETLGLAIKRVESDSRRVLPGDVFLACRGEFTDGRDFIPMDKWRTKLVWQGAGLPVPEFVLLDDQTDFAEVEARLGLPLFVKPACEGSSFGVTKVKNPGEIRAAYAEARKYDQLVLAERYIGGGEYTCAVLGARALPSIKIEPATEFYDYDAKYFRDDTVYRCPAGLSAEAEQQMRALALKAFKVLGGRGWGRVDFLMDEAGHPYLLEVNTAPGMIRAPMSPPHTPWM